MLRKHIGMTLGVGVGVCALLWKRPPLEWTTLRIFGMVLLLTGFVLWTVARFQLGSSFAVKAEARHLVTHGLYSKIRNPIYVFGSWVIAGGILPFANPRWLLIFVLLVPLQLWRAKKESSARGGL